jgi:arsenate reductase
MPQRREHTSTEPVIMSRVFKVLFLCTRNSARSIMAEAILNRVARGKFEAYSAGSQPGGEIHPFTVDLLRKLNYDVSGLRSKSWDEFASETGPKLDFVFTVCDDAAGETCPLWSGDPLTAHWGIPDPVIVEGTEVEQRLAFAEAYRLLNTRIGVFISLPVDSLDRRALQMQLGAIGQPQAS